MLRSSRVYLGTDKTKVIGQWSENKVPETITFRNNSCPPSFHSIAIIGQWNCLA